MRRLLIVLAAALLLLPAGGVASAHTEDPEVVTVLDAVTPVLPGVQVRVATGVTAQLLLVNTTPTPAEVLDEQGRPFLRIGPSDVQADQARVATYQAENPFGRAALPAAVQADPDGPPRFATVATGNAYGWFDHRLHPGSVMVPAAARTVDGPTTLAQFTVPVRLGGVTAAVTGHLEFRPHLGAFTTTADPAPAGVQAVVLTAAVPQLAVTVQPGRTVVVQGTQGEPFARLGPGGAEVNELSPTWVADAEGRGLSPGPSDPAAAPRWRQVGTSPTLTWADARLRWPDPLPPAAALSAASATALGSWTVPATVDGSPVALTGTIGWQPDTARRPAAARTSGRSSAGTVRYVAVAVGAVAAAAVVLAVGGVVRRRRRAAS